MKDQADNILEFHKAHKRMPSYAEIMKLLGFKSKNAVYKLVNKLIEQGIVRKDSTGRLIPNVALGEVQVLGLVEAGFPTNAEETVLDTMNIDDYLIERKGATYMLEVKGESMIDAGIQEGDLVVAERGKEPKVGDIVIAEVDGGWTLKYYRKTNGKVWLEPANKHFKPIYPTETLNIAAVVKGVVRKY